LLRIGIAGFGLAGEFFHAPLIAAVPELRLAAVITGNPGRAARARARYPGVVVGRRVEPVLDGLDALVVAAPNRVHAELALLAFARGVAVIMDKPLAAAVDDARAVVQAGGDRLTVFQNRRWDGDFLTVCELVAQGALGPVTRLESRFERFRPDVAAGAWRELADPLEGGGVLLDLGSHLVDQAIRLLGPVSEVHSELDIRRASAAVPDDAFLSLRHADGARSHLYMSAVAPLHGPRFRVGGLTGGFACDGLDPQEAQLRAGMSPLDAGFGVGGRGRVVGADGIAEVELRTGRYLEFYERVPAWLRGEAPPPVEASESLAVQELLAAAAEAAGYSSRQRKYMP
jgi:predicted dehydrogenase